MSDDLRTSCIKHPANDSYIRVHDWQLVACDGNECAAALLSFFESWHNFKLKERLKAKQRNEVARNHNDDPVADESLWQFHTEEQLERGVKLFKKDTIRKAIKLLEDKGFVTKSNNPNPRYKFDRTYFFKLHTAVINRWLSAFESTSTTNQLSSNEKSIIEAGEIENGSAENQESSIANNHTNNHTNSLRGASRTRAGYDTSHVSFQKAMMAHQFDVLGKTKKDGACARACFEMLKDYAQDISLLARTELLIKLFDELFSADKNGQYFSGWLTVQAKFPVWYAKRKPAQSNGQQDTAQAAFKATLGAMFQNASTDDERIAISDILDTLDFQGYQAAVERLRASAFADHQQVRALLRKDVA